MNTRLPAKLPDDAIVAEDVVQELLNEERLQDLTSKEREARRSVKNRSTKAEEKNINRSTKAEEKNIRLLRQLEAVHASRSWRVTSPLRAIMRMLSRQHRPT